MSDGEELLRGELARVFDPYAWYSDETGECVVHPDSVLNWVIDTLKERNWFIYNGNIYEPHILGGATDGLGRYWKVERPNG